MPYIPTIKDHVPQFKGARNVLAEGLGFRVQGLGFMAGDGAAEPSKFRIAIRSDLAGRLRI